jgi:crotonobetainyl-CoA:carnitine CoA-transferase CaiB-like acyl-CoA transferase
VNSGRANAVPHRPAPACGEHTRQVLREGGYVDDEVDALLRAGVIRCEPLVPSPSRAAG